MFNTIDEVLEDLRQGRMIIVMDDEGRENEGDLLIAAQFVKPENINFMAREARGLICVPMEEEKLARLLKVNEEQLNLKAGTTEKLGWIGRGQGMAAIAVVLLEKDRKG